MMVLAPLPCSGCRSSTPRAWTQPSTCAHCRSVRPGDVGRGAHRQGACRQGACRHSHSISYSIPGFLRQQHKHVCTCRTCSRSAPAASPSSRPAASLLASLASSCTAATRLLAPAALLLPVASCHLSPARPPPILPAPSRAHCMTACRRGAVCVRRLLVHRGHAANQPHGEAQQGTARCRYSLLL